MKNEDVVLDFINRNKRGICFLMGVSEKGLKEQDIKIMMSYLTYKAGKSSEQGEFDLSIITELEKLPVEKKCEAVLLKACEWFERGELFSRPIHNAITSDLNFSARVESALKIRYEAKLKREFGELSQSVIRMKKHTANIARILKNHDNLHDKSVVSEIKAEYKALRFAIQSANYRAKAGMIWGHKHGLPIETSIKGITLIYLRHLRELANTLGVIDHYLEANKIRTNGRELAVRHYDKWRSELGSALEVYREKNPEKSANFNQPAFG